MAKSDIETIVGNLSWYQLFMWFVPSTYMMLFGLNNVLPVFVQAEPNFTCKVFENQTWVEANSTTNNCGMEHNNCKIPGSNSSDTTNCEDFVFDRSEQGRRRGFGQSYYFFLTGRSHVSRWRARRLTVFNHFYCPGLSEKFPLSFFFFFSPFFLLLFSFFSSFFSTVYVFKNQLLSTIFSVI